MVVFVLCLVCGTEPSSLSAAPPPISSLRRYHEIREDVRETMQREATAATKVERAAAIVHLTRLYQELRNDPRLAESDTLMQTKNLLWGRLTRVKTSLQREFAQTQRPPRSEEHEHDPELTDAVTWAMTENLAMAGCSVGGPASLFAQVRGAAGGAAISDYGPALVALIERTIAPEFWDVTGGPGAVAYYAPLRALVVRATSEIHHRIGGVLGDLREAGR